jgi:hypothetical protein
MKKSIITVLTLFLLIFCFYLVVFAEKEDLPKTGGDMICAVGVNCDDDQPVSCMALHCKKPHPPKPIRPEPVKPLPIVVDDTVVCMGLNCPKLPDEKEDTDSLPEWEIPECSIIDNPIVTPYLPPPLPPACLGAYIDENGQLRNPCVERQVKENNEDEIKKHEKKVRDAANREAKLVKESIEKSRELEKTKKELEKAAKDAKKEALEARKATDKVIKSNNKKQRELAQQEAKKQIKEANRAAEKAKQLEKKLKEINKVSDSARAAAKKARVERELAKEVAEAAKKALDDEIKVIEPNIYPPAPVDPIPTNLGEVTQ